MLKLIIIGLKIFLCLNLSHAQTPPPPAAPGAPPAAGSTPEGAANSLLGSVTKVAPGKYEEYQSICRTNDYDTVSYLSAEIKKKRLDIIQKKFSDPKDIIKLKIRLLKEYVEQKNKTEITNTYNDLKALKISDAENSFIDAMYFYNQKNYKKAKKNMLDLVAESPKNFEYQKFLAEVYKVEKIYYEATTIYEDLIKDSAEKPYALLCETLALNSIHVEADKICRKAFSENPKDPYPYLFLGVSKRENEEPKEALLLFKKSLDIKKTEMGYTCLAELYFIQNNLSESTKTFLKSVELAPYSVRAILGLAWSQLKEKNIPDALASFKKACQLDKKLQAESRKAFKYLLNYKSKDAIKFLDLAQQCIDF